MLGRGIPEHVQRFILQHINSVEQLEVLLLLAGHPDRVWTAESVSAELRIDINSAAGRLVDLQGRGLLANAGQEGSFRYTPASTDLRKTVADLAEIYRTFRVRIINLIFSKPIDQIRTVADAFKLREDK